MAKGKRKKRQPIQEKSVIYLIKAAFPAEPDTFVQDDLDHAIDILRGHGAAMVVDMSLVDKPLDEAMEAEFDKDAEFLLRGKMELQKARERVSQLEQAFQDVADIVNPAILGNWE